MSWDPIPGYMCIGKAIMRRETYSNQVERGYAET